MRRISKKKVCITGLILIVIGMLAYFGFGYFGALGGGDGATGMNVFYGLDTLGDSGEGKSPDDKIVQEVKNLVEEAGNEKITILVKQDDNEKVSESVKKIGGEIKGRALDYMAIEIPADKINELAENKDVIGVYSDRKYYAELDKSVGLVNADKFWSNGYTGAGVKIAILDTGIDESNPMLRGKVIAVKVFTGDSNSGDVRGHGTHVAGIAAGKYNNEGFNGVAKDALLMNAKVLNDAEGSGMTLQIVQGIEWAVDPDNNVSTDDGADVISMSLGGAYSTPDQPYIDAVKYAISRNVVVVAAAGNCGQCASSSCGGFRGVTVPGSIKEVITVGAVDDSKNIACFSSGQDINGVGIKPDVVAPGVQIASSVPGGYGNMSGTSMAAPHIAGVAALLLGKNPGYGHEQIKHLLEASADDLGNAGKDTSYGSGFVNLEKAYSFEVGNLLEYDVGFNARVVKGKMQRITANISDDVAVLNVSLQLTYPNGEKKEFNLSSIGNKEYEINISNLDEGGYAFNLVIAYGSGLMASRNNKFDVVAAPAYSGEIVNVRYNKNVVQGENLDINVSFTNFNSTPLRTFIEVQILKDDSVIDSFTSNAVDVYSGLLNEGVFVERDAEDSFSCRGDFNDGNCSGAVDENWETAASTAASSWDRSLGCIAGAYVYENFTLGALSNINLTLKTNLANNFSCTIPFTEGNTLQLRTRLDVKNNACMTICTFAMTEHYYGCPADYWNGSSWIPALGGFNQLDESGCKKELTNYYEGRISYNETREMREHYTFNIEMPVNVGPGDYSLRVIAYYDNGQDVMQGSLYVNDLNPPKIIGVNFSNSLIEDSPQVIQVGVEENGDVKGFVYLTNQDNETFNLALAGLEGEFFLQNSVAWASFLDTKPGEYKFNFSLCDESGNCAESENYNFSVRECRLGRKILFVYNDEPELLNSFVDDYCIAGYPKKRTPELSINYLKRFDAVVLNSGNSLHQITENDTRAFIEYEAMNRSILLEGADIAFQYGDNEFMREVAHAVLLHDLSFASSSASSSGANGGVYLINRKNFPLVKDLNDKIDFDSAASSYPDSLQAVNNGKEIISWGDNQTAVVVNEYGARTLFIPFSVMALHPNDREELLNESLAWLTDDTEGDLKAEILLPGYLVEGGNWFTLQMESSVTDTHEIEILIDDKIVESRTTARTAAGKGLSQITIQKDFERGNHTVIGKVNADFTARERYYLNNYAEKPVWVAGKRAEIVIENVNYTFAENQLLVRAGVVNQGGSDLNFTLFFDVNGSMKSRSISLPFSWMTIVRERFDVGRGVYPVKIIADADDENQENNVVNLTVYLCSKTPVLVVDDYDEGFATNNPGSAGAFESVLKQEGYCVDVWDVQSRGYPSNSYLEPYPAVIWSRGDYFGNRFNDSVMNALVGYSGNLLFEGADIGFDGNNALFNSFGAEFSRDIILRNSTKLQLSNHSLLSGVGELEINDTLSPYPDSAKIITAENVADWGDGKAAIVAYQIGNKRKVYLGFSIDAVTDENARKQIVVNAMNWFGEGGEVIREFSDGKHEKYFGLNESWQDVFVNVPKGRGVQDARLFISSGRILADEQKLDKLNDNSTSDILDLTKDKNVSVYVRLPKNAVVVDAGYDLELETSPVTNDITPLKVESTATASGSSFGSSISSQNAGEQYSVGDGSCSISGYNNCYEWWRTDEYTAVKSRFALNIPSVYSGNLGGFTGYYSVGSLRFDYYCRAITGDREMMYYSFTKVPNDFGCNKDGCSAVSGTTETISTFNGASPGNTFNSLNMICWVYDGGPYDSWTWGWAGFKDIGYGQSVHVVNCYSDSDCGQGRKCYKPGSWNTWHCGAQPACNSNSDCGSDGWAGTPECNGNNVQQEYKINYCNDPGTEGAYCSFSTDTRVKLTCSSGQYCSSGGCVAAECNANSDCGSDGFTNTGYCKEGDVYRDYSVHACSNPGGAQASCSSNSEQRLVQDCTAREICENGGCKAVACFAASECGVDGFVGENYCNENKVFGTYKNYTCNNPGLASASCLPAENAVLIKECSNGEYCFSGECVKALCSVKTDCGNDGFIGERYCNGKGVYQKYRTFACLSGGMQDAKCDLGYEEKKIEDCNGACFKGSCVEGVDMPRAYIGNWMVWRHDGKFTGPASVNGLNGLVDAMNDELKKCETEYCDIEIKFDADTSGSVELSNINISYYIDKGYPGNLLTSGEEVAIKIGVDNIWNNPGRFNGQASVRDVQGKINSYLQRCQAGLDGYCKLPISAYGKKGVVKISNLQLQLSGVVDMDYDGVVDSMDNDKDNDGVEDAQDKLLGGVHDIKTNIPDLVLDVKQDNDMPQYVIKEENKPVLEFSVLNDVIDFSNIIIVKQDSDADNGYVIVKGLELDEGNTKTVYVDRLMTNATGVCVKDVEVSSIQEISEDCGGADELYLPCNGFDNLDYKCELIDGKYKISGLHHSGVIETDNEFDFDSDGYYSILDCDDTNRNIHPGAVESCNARDDDCDNNVDEDLTKQYGSTDVGECSYGSKRCDAGAWNVDMAAVTATDETCDNLDNNCDGKIDGGLVQSRGCGFGVCSGGLQTKTCSSGVWPEWGVCSTANKASAETCDNIDNDCDGGVDEELKVNYYEDSDGDGYGNSGKSVNECSSPKGYSSRGGDCNDNNGNVHALVCLVCGGEKSVYYRDEDGDGFGNKEKVTSSCQAGAGYVANSEDCDDSDNGIHESIDGVCGGALSTYYEDKDKDGFGNPSKPVNSRKPVNDFVSNNDDCDDRNAGVFKLNVCNVCGEPDPPFNYRDADADGYGDANNRRYACEQREGYISNNLDCDDGNKELNPVQKELCNQKDDDCDGGIDEDLKADGGWSAWGDFPGCNAACGGGLQTRTRVCDNPAPFCGGKQCEGDSVESMACNTMECTSLSMKADINTLLLGESFNIEWDAKGAFVCAAFGDWSGRREFSGKQVITPENVGLRKYVIDCFTIMGDVIASQTIQVNVEQPGDFDKTSCVDLDDFFLFANHYGLSPGGDLWDTVYDLDKNSVVDLEDFFKFAEYYGKGNCNQNAAAKKAYISQEQLEACKNPSQEKCNNLDDNCDGNVDENACNLKSDFNADGCVDYDDFFLFGDNFGSDENRYDLNSDKIVDMLDYDLFYQDFGKGC